MICCSQRLKPPREEDVGALNKGWCFPPSSSTEPWEAQLQEKGSSVLRTSPACSHPGLQHSPPRTTPRPEGHHGPSHEMFLGTRSLPVPFFNSSAQRGPTGLALAPEGWEWAKSPETKFSPKPVKHPLVVYKGYETAVTHISVLQWDTAERQEAAPQPFPLHSSHRQRNENGWGGTPLL